ncbi:uncharacterized protein LOC133297872 [Gastrolobium bilobum]|uniref:uncharacterized protein LOC133297872 n=1 Tax=Gastrolobium bilobum TaxID=150636 RepID=UPI002AB15B74|nr:uncharacterized protein LOC133297872 [Gastrolobium bilobum]
MEALIIYLSVGDVAISSVLVQEDEKGQQPIYFTSRLLQGAELRYQKLEKVAFSLLIYAGRLRPYFQGHEIVVWSDLPISKILHKPDLAGRMMSWAIELSEFDITFESRKAIKSQALADFVKELTSIQTESSHSLDFWKVYVDGSSNSKGSGAEIIIESPEGVSVEYSIQMSSYQAKGPLLIKYLDPAKQLTAEFEKVDISHIPRNENGRADILSKLASTKGRGNHRTVVEQNIPELTCVMQIAEIDDWRCSIIDYLENRVFPSRKEEARKLIRDAALYTMVEGQLYEKGVYSPLLKCMSSDRAHYVLSEIHEGINGQHVGEKALARKAIRAGYFWPSISNDAKEHVQRYDQCQRHGKNLLAHP